MTADLSSPSPGVLLGGPGQAYDKKIEQMHTYWYLLGIRYRYVEHTAQRVQRHGWKLYPLASFDARPLTK